MTIDELEQLADAIGVTVTRHTVGPKGWYQHHNRTISLHASLAGPAERCTLAHELGHAMAGDEPTGVDWADQRAERAADRFAAELLISPAEYALAEQMYGPEPGAIARELGVTRHLLDVWCGVWARRPV